MRFKAFQGIFIRVSSFEGFQLIQSVPMRWKWLPEAPGSFQVGFGDVSAGIQGIPRRFKNFHGGDYIFREFQRGFETFQNVSGGFGICPNLQ